MTKSKMKLSFMVQGAGMIQGDWRHPDMPPNPGTNFQKYKEQAQSAERAMGDTILVADTVWADARTSVGPRLDRFEAMTILSALATVTKNIGLLGTISSTFTEPYNAARLLLSLDHISGGRAAWNLVTSVPTGAGGNFGQAEATSHAERYQMAAEYVDVVKGLWDSFEDDAFPQDKEAGVFMTPSKMHTLDHKGRYYQVKGPLNLHRSVQGHLPIVTATGSEDGKTFAAKHADWVFNSAWGFEENQAFYSDIKAKAKGFGREPGELTVLVSYAPLIADTLEEAEELLALRNRNSPIEGAINYMGSAYFTGTEIKHLGLDDPFPRQILEKHEEGMQGVIRQMMKAVDERNATLRDLALRFGAPPGTMVGTPMMIADHMERWVSNGATDGFIIMEGVPGQFDVFADKVTPILQERGLLRTEYTGRTLRENMGLEKPENRFVRAARMKSAS